MPIWRMIGIFTVGIAVFAFVSVQERPECLPAAGHLSLSMGVDPIVCGMISAFTKLRSTTRECGEACTMLSAAVRLDAAAVKKVFLQRLPIKKTPQSAPVSEGNDPSDILREYLVARYPDPQKIVEIGIGPNPHCAGILAESFRLPVEIVVTDLFAPIVRNAVMRYPFLRGEVDDVMQPDMRIYQDAQVIYALRPQPGLFPFILKIAQTVGADMLVVIYDGEEMEMRSQIGQWDDRLSGFPYSLFLYQNFEKMVFAKYIQAGANERARIIRLLMSGMDNPQTAPLATKIITDLIQRNLISGEPRKIAESTLGLKRQSENVVQQAI
ncbi:MAG: UPF0146 family protein [Candidatus Omnitrophica bacterium]|nr:UPF0146 family protein [Candidatus Omnitrophota bacterium]